MMSVLRQLLTGGHAQTLSCALPYVPRAHAARALRFGHRWFDAERGEVLARTIYHGDEPRRTAVLVHGVGGSEASLYVRRAEVAFLDAGYHVISLNQRGAGDGASRAASLYHAGLTADLDRVLRALGRESIHDGVSVVGFSGGGNVALRLAAEWKSAIPKGVVAMVGVSAPLDLALAARNIESRERSVYRLHVLRGLLRGARHFLRFNRKSAPYTLSDLLSIRTLRDFDARVTVPMHGFASVDAYYASAGAGPLLSAVRIPSLAVHADDDPMVPGTTVHSALAAASPSLETAIAPGGGHLGFVSNLTREGLTRTWAMDRTLRFFDRVYSARVKSP